MSRARILAPAPSPRIPGEEGSEDKAGAGRGVGEKKNSKERQNRSTKREEGDSQNETKTRPLTLPVQDLLGTHTTGLRGESMGDSKGVTEEGTGARAAGKGDLEDRKAGD